MARLKNFGTSCYPGIRIFPPAESLRNWKIFLFFSLLYSAGFLDFWPTKLRPIAIHKFQTWCPYVRTYVRTSARKTKTLCYKLKQTTRQRCCMGPGGSLNSQDFYSPFSFRASNEQKGGVGLIWAGPWQGC